MAKRRKNQKTLKQPLAQNNPFKALKGFAVSAEVEEKRQTKSPPPLCEAQGEVDFSAAMTEFGVQVIRHNNDLSTAESEQVTKPESPQEHTAIAKDDRELFLQAMDSLNVDFADQLPETQEVVVPSLPRMKQLRRGQIVPEATLDLHGVLRHEVNDKMSHFLQRATHQGAAVVLVITGKGLHSASGEPIVRREVEAFLQREGNAAVAQWGRAPRRYGGEGALVLFLRRRQQ